MKSNTCFAASYSGGKDSILAIYRAIRRGFTPFRLITTYDEKNQRSWFHSIPKSILNQAADAMGIPLSIIKTEGERYAHDFEAELRALKELGVNTCVFGDIDIQEHFDWCDSRCRNAGINSYFPLWQESRKDLVYEFINCGFKAIITVVDSSRMDEGYVGQILTKELVQRIEDDGVDICGENGEYHTFVFDGPIFHRPLDVSFGEAIKTDKYVRIPFISRT
ncbi:MAG TPA: diphthine--ammonia ligase [Clostridiales bacterium]|nr:diphthine--ammonia ligase [Clostridiales bacterium]